MGSNIEDLEARIMEGRERIAEERARGRQIGDWETHLAALEKKYEAALKESKASAFQGKNEFHIFTNHTLPQVQEWLLERTLEEIKRIYISNLYQWIEANRPDLETELKELEAKLNSYAFSSTNYDEFKSLLQSYWRWHVKALTLFKEHTPQFHSEVCDCPTCYVDKHEFFLSQPNPKGGDSSYL